jgi:hypothetical protein
MLGRGAVLGAKIAQKLAETAGFFCFGLFFENFCGFFLN